MARRWPHQRWRWLLLIVTVSGGLLRLSRAQNPSAAVLGASTPALVPLATTTTTTTPTTTSPPPSPTTAITPTAIVSLSSGDRIVLFLRDRCDAGFNGTELMHELLHGTGDATIGMLPTTDTCEARSRGLEALVHALSQKSTKALIAQLDYSTCDVAAKLAHMWNKSLVTWTCPQKTEEDRKLSSVVRLSASPVVLGRALVEIFRHFRWKSVAVIGVDKTAWTSLDRSVISALRTIGIVPRHHAILPVKAIRRQIRTALRPLRSIPVRAIIVCLPLRSRLLSRTLAELDTMQDSRLPHGGAAIILVVYPFSPRPFLPPIPLYPTPANVTLRRNQSESVYFGSSPESIDVDNETTSGVINDDKSKQEAGLLLENNDVDVDDDDDDEDEEKEEGADKSFLTGGSFVPPQGLSRRTLENLLAIVPFDQRYDVQRVLNGTTVYQDPGTMDYLREALDVLTNDSGSAGLNSFNNKMFTYGLLSYGSKRAWEPIITVTEKLNGLKLTELVRTGFYDEQVDLLCDDQSDCPGELERMSGYSLGTAHIVAIILGSLLFALTAIIVAALIRRHLLKKRMSKGPYKIILTATDFVFPRIPDASRVDEGIEAMLCCWLQQLQEFGGPEVEKPDLLQGSVGSLRPHLQASNGSLARHIFTDPRARYNGDLVQLKQLPIQGGAFELKGKSMDMLVSIHGLRHENLNPLIGCLTEPSRPCLVYEYCSRGSLEDVLVQDEIKLDWSFRLSLLTDLVRGMKYLHSTPIRVHGYLTSRNCVIDARWVLKVTDYGLPAFYEAQNVQPPAKSARELLWTAPELLRNASLLKRGSQPGDVYSFGIIMQEVVVRGEPFCMLALSPEDIIEKVKKPPPLIRPSVSKGAAPPEAINIMRQCWAENADMRPDFNSVHDLFKKLNHGRKVNFVDTMFQMLEKYSNNLEELIRERTEQLDMEKKKTEQLLNRMLPSSVAEKLKLGMPVDPEEFAEVTIYFSDIVGFTTISAYSTPFQVVDLLNDLYTCFDATINAYNVYKVETIGDAYMVVGGCPVRIPDHASQIATMALDLLHQSGKFKLRHLPKTQLRLRIGLHTGPCCAGVVGLTMPRYCLFGDTVNTASRMESTGAPWRIHLSQATRDRLTQVGGYVIEYRGRTEIKGKGKMPTYWLLGKQDFDKELPVPPPLGEDHGLDEILILETLQTDEEQQQLSAAGSSTGQVQQAITGGATTVASTSGETSSSLPQLTTHLPGLNSQEDDSSAECSVAVSLPAQGSVLHGHPSPGQFARSEHSSMERSSSICAENLLVSRRVPVSVHDSLGTSFSVEQVAGGPGSASVTKSTSGDNPMMLARNRKTSSSFTESGLSFNVGRLQRARTACARVREMRRWTDDLIVKEDESNKEDDFKKAGTPVSATDVAAALLGASTSSINSASSSVFRSRGMGPRAASRVGVIDEDDLSTPYNHYRCLSPNEHHGSKATFEPLDRISSFNLTGLRSHGRNQLLGRSRIKSLDIESSIAAGRNTGCRLLRRQFSLDRADEPTTSSMSVISEQGTSGGSRTPRLFKQNSAGAANDLERIEEVPSTPTASSGYRHSTSVSLSVESLTLGR